LKKLGELIAGEIRRSGPITFARFMELALYCPVYGYYERQEDTIGRRGGFLTSVSVGGLFGELLAFQFSEWLEEIPPRSRKAQAPADESASGGSAVVAEAPERKVQLVEAGAHDGRLAGDILEWLRRHRAGLFERLEYWILEPSAQRRERQQCHLSQFSPVVKWTAGFEELRRVGRPQSAAREAPCVCGVIFSNELLDALPVHRFGWDVAERRWFEWGVRFDAGRFQWARLPLGETRFADDQIAALAPALPDGFTIELCPAAAEWWLAAASSLRGGKLLTIDYGCTADERVLPERPQGTLRAFYGHHPSEDLLARPGEQDLTADVDFTELIRAGESAGLTTEQFVTQEKFLMEIARRVWHGGASDSPWTPERRRQFQTLTHPDHLGRAFRVLVQSRT